MTEWKKAKTGSWHLHVESEFLATVFTDKNKWFLHHYGVAKRIRLLGETEGVRLEEARRLIEANLLKRLRRLQSVIKEVQAMRQENPT